MWCSAAGLEHKACSGSAVRARSGQQGRALLCRVLAGRGARWRRRLSGACAQRAWDVAREGACTGGSSGLSAALKGTCAHHARADRLAAAPRVMRPLAGWPGACMQTEVVTAAPASEHSAAAA